MNDEEYKAPDRYNPELCASWHMSINRRLTALLEETKERVSVCKESLITLLTTRTELTNQAHELHVKSMVEALDAIRDNFDKAEARARALDNELRGFVLMQLSPLKEEQTEIKQRLERLDKLIQSLETFRDKMVGAYILAMILYPILTGIIIHMLKKAFGG